VVAFSLQHPVFLSPEHFDEVSRFFFMTEHFSLHFPDLSAFASVFAFGGESQKAGPEKAMKNMANMTIESIFFIF
jgi:hypothetical protein